MKKSSYIRPPIPRDDCPDLVKKAKVKTDFFGTASVIQYIVVGTVKKVGRVLVWTYKIIKGYPTSVDYVYRHKDKGEVEDFVRNARK